MLIYRCCKDAKVAVITSKLLSNFVLMRNAQSSYLSFTIKVTNTLDGKEKVCNVTN